MNQHVVQISAGTGPAEVCRFVAMLAERIEALCAEGALVVREVALRGSEIGPRSVEIVVEGDALTVLAGEIGTHALVARSADRGRDARKRWFAGVAVLALDLDAAEAGAAPVIDPRDLEITATTAPGPGGQHVNKTATAVRVRHRPTGIVVRVCDERSQRANLRRAVERLTARLAQAAEGRRAASEQSRRLTHYRVERGAPVRTYTLGPRGELVRMKP